jgi:hypothetical protein
MPGRVSQAFAQSQALLAVTRDTNGKVGDFA